MSEVVDNPVMDLPMAEIHFDQEFNCRGAIIPFEVNDLAKNIEKTGLLQPVVVMVYSAEKQTATGFKYLLIAGYRRFFAHKVLNRTIIRATVRPTLSEIDARAINLAENFERKDLNILQEARAIKKLADLGLSEDQAAEVIGKSRGWVQVRFILLKLPNDIQEACATGIYNQLQVRDIYTHYKNSGLDAAYEAMRTIKDAKLKEGKTIRLKKKTNPNTKRQRARAEIFEMMSHLKESIGQGLHNRCLAWAAGEISDLELYHSVKLWDEQNGTGNYVIPA